MERDRSIQIDLAKPQRVREERETETVERKEAMDKGFHFYLPEVISLLSINTINGK